MMVCSGGVVTALLAALDNEHNVFVHPIADSSSPFTRWWVGDRRRGAIILSLLLLYAWVGWVSVAERGRWVVELSV